MAKAPTRHLIDAGAGTITIGRWDDPLVERHGYPADGDYLEYFWVGTLGPTATWLYRRLARVAALHPLGVAVDLSELATSLGLGWDNGRATPLVRSIDRLVLFGLARPLIDLLQVRTAVPPLNVKQCERLPVHLRAAHLRWLASSATQEAPLPLVSGAPKVA